MNKKTALAYAIIGVLTNGQSVVAEGLNEKLSFHAVKGAKSTGIQLIPIGPASSSKGDYSLAAGKYADSEGSHSISLGVESHSKGEYSFAAGVNAKSTGIQSIAIGPASSSKGDYSLAAGKYADSQGSHSISLGVESHSKGEYSFAAGVRAESPGKQSIAIGTVSSSKGDYSVAAGKYADSQGSHSISLGVKSHSKGEYSFAAGVSAESPGKQSIAIGSNSQSTGDYSLALGSDSKADRKYDDGQLSAIKAEQDNQLGSEKIREVSLGVLKNKGEGSVFSQITHVAPGTKDTDAVNLYQLKRIKRDLDERIGEVEKIKTTKNNVERFQNEGSSASQLTTQHRDNAKTALTESQTHRDNAKVVLDATVKHRNNANLALVETQGHRDNAKGASEIAKTALMETQTHRDNAYDALKMVKVHENSADSIVKRLKREALLLDGEITQSSDGTMYIGKELEGSQIFVSGKQGDRVIRGVASGVRNSDAVNVSQLNTVRTTANYASQLAQKNSSRINHLEDKLSKTNTKIERGLATSAALTGLFQPYGVGKVNFTASIGGYGASQALAVGTGYRITENAAVKAGVAYSGGNHVMYNASFNFEW